MSQTSFPYLLSLADVRMISLLGDTCKQILNRTLEATYRSYLVRQFSEILTIESVYVSDTTTTTTTTTNAPKPPCPFPLCLRGCPLVRGPDKCLHCVCLDCQVNYMMWIATFILLYTCSLHVNSLWRWLLYIVLLR